jgi:hypothetical protein
MLIMKGGMGFVLQSLADALWQRPAEKPFTQNS